MKNLELFQVPAINGEVINRIEDCDTATFCHLVLIMAKGGRKALDEFLSDKNPDCIKEYQRIWDKCESISTGVLFPRPDFEAIIKGKEAQL